MSTLGSWVGFGVVAAGLCTVVVARMGATRSHRAARGRTVERATAARDESPLVWLHTRFFMARAREDRYDAQLVRFVLSLSAALRAGNSVIGAWDSAKGPCTGALRVELDRVTAHVERGWTVRAAIGDWESCAARPSVRLLAGAMLLGGSTGGRLADALDSVAATVATQQELDAERRALSSQARASAALLVLAPVAFSAAAALIDPRVGRGLFASPIGLTSIAVAGCLDTMGWRWMRRIVRSTT